MKKYIRANEMDTRSDLIYNLTQQLQDEFEDNIALQLDSKSGYDATYAPDDYNPNLREIRILEAARDQYLNALANVLLLNK